MRRRKDKIDGNQNAIVSELRRIPGVSVETGHDDILVGYQGRTYWFEIKAEDALSKKTGEIRDSALKDSQKTLIRDFNGHYRVVWSIVQILEDVGILNDLP